MNAEQNKDLRVAISVVVNTVWLRAIKSFQLEITVQLTLLHLDEWDISVIL